MTEEKNRLKVLSIKKDCVSLQANQVCPDFIDIQNAKLCASFSHNGNLRNSKREDGECCTVVSAPLGADFCHIPFLRLSQDLRWKNMGLRSALLCIINENN